MMTLPAALAAKLKSNDLRGIKPIVLMYRNKWDAQTNAYAPETTPIDITEQVIKCGTLSTKLDVGEINEYTASNVTLTISDPQNHFVEGTPKSYFPDGYQIYGSRIELYAGTDTSNMTPLFYGVIRSLPNHKPEEYQLDISVVSALELLDDVEAKDFSTPYTGEKLTLDHQDDDAGPVYRTANTGVGGFTAVYANGSVLVEGVDYEVSQLSENTQPALVEILNESYFSSTITADYYCWHNNLAVEEIIKGLLNIANIDPNTSDVREVVWENSVRVQAPVSLAASVGYTESGNSYIAKDDFNGNNFTTQGRKYLRYSRLPSGEFKISANFLAYSGDRYIISNTDYYYFIGETDENNNAVNGLLFHFNGPYNYSSSSGVVQSYFELTVQQVTHSANGPAFTLASRRVGNIYDLTTTTSFSITRQNNNVSVSGELGTVNYEFATGFDFGNSSEWNEFAQGQNKQLSLISFSLEIGNDNTAAIKNCGLIWENSPKTTQSLSSLTGTVSNEDAKYTLTYRIKSNGNFSSWTAYDFGEALGVVTDDIQFLLNVTDGTVNFNAVTLEYLSTKLVMQLVNLTEQTVLEAIEDLALITGYEFGIDRNNVFFFRPRQTSTQPVAVLDEMELVKIDTVTRNFNELATKLTLTFAAAPLEFYANTGARPTPVDKYGVIEKEIDKPQLINYDNPELAQAIGPQLLAIYSELPNIITCTGKLNLALELGDIVNLKREMPLTINPEASDYTKYEGLNTFYRACKITGLNYDFTKRQIKYTLRDVSNANNAPVKDYYEYQTIFPTPLDYKE